MGWPSCRPRRWLKVADGSKDLAEDITGHSDLGQLEGDLARVAHDPCSNFDEAALDAGQRPVSDLLGEVCAPKKTAEIVGQCV